MKKILILPIFLLNFLTLWAKVTLFDCIDAALNNSIDIKIQQLEIENKNRLRQNNIYSFLPSVIISKTLVKGINNLKNEDDALSVSADISLFDNRIWNYKFSNLDLKQKKLEYAKVQRELIINVANDFLSLNLLNEKQNYYQNIIKVYNEQLELTKKLLKSGNKTEFDLYSIEIELENNKIELENIKNEITKILTDLNFLTGLSLKNSEELKQFDINTKNNPQKLSLERAYQILTEKILLKNAKIDKFSMLTNLLPNIYLQGLLSHSETNNKYEILNTENWNKYWEVSLNFKFDLGNFLQNYNNFRMADITIHRKKLELKKTEMLLKKTLENKKNFILMKRRQIMLDMKKLNFLTEKYNLAKDKFKNGLIDFFMFKETANDLLSAKISIIKDKKDYLINLLEYRKLQGKKIFEKY